MPLLPNPMLVEVIVDGAMIDCAAAVEAYRHLYLVAAHQAAPWSPGATLCGRLAGSVGIGW